jgi:HK97 family phage portal protein
VSATALVRSFVRNVAIRIKAIPANLQSVNDRGWFKILESFSGAWQQNVEISLDGVLRHPTVFSCVTLIAFDVAKLRLRLVEEVAQDVWTETESAAFSPVLRRPNSYQTRIQFYITWMISKLIHGNTYVLKQRDNRGGEFQGTIVGEYVLDPNRIRPLVAPDGSVFYEVKRDDLSRVNLDVIVIPASEIIHDVYAPLYHPLVGVSPIHAIGTAATQAQHIQSNSANFYANSAMPGGTLTAPGTIPQETADRLKADWTTNYGGENTGKVAILGDGLKYEPLKYMSAVDAQVIEQLNWADAKVCSAYHVPGFKVGVGDFPPYNTSVQLNQDYYSTCVQIHLESIELLQDQALGLLEGRINGRRLGTEFDIDGLVRMDPASQIEAEGNAVTKSLKQIDEARRKLNLPPVEGGDTIWMQRQNWPLRDLANRTMDDLSALPPARIPSSDPDDEDMPMMDDEAAEKFIAGMKRKALEIAARAA